ncbi:MAG: bifunctional ADP-heptose synthase [Bacteroidota bacterium]
MSYNSIDEIFEAFKDLKVLIIGDVMVDAYIWGAVQRISPEAPVPIVRAQRRDYRLGGAANVALNVQALGAEPILCSLIGNDEGADQFLERLNTREIFDIGIMRSDSRPTTVKTRVISGNQHIVRVDEESEAQLSVDEERLLWERIKMLLPQSQLVIFEDYDKGVLNNSIIENTIELANGLGIPTVVDPKKRNFLNYNGCTLFKPNLKELKDGLSMDFDENDPAELELAVDKLIKQLKCESVLLTLSDKGIHYGSKKNKFSIPAHLREIADISGAGDTVISIAGLAVALGLPANLVAEFSNLGGGLVCQHQGVVPVDKQELLSEIKQKDLL